LGDPGEPVLGIVARALLRAHGSADRIPDRLGLLDLGQRRGAGGDMATSRSWIGERAARPWGQRTTPEAPIWSAHISVLP
jgi:hypothetical protein